MAITLRASNTQLTTSTPFSYLGNNYASGVSSFVLTNVNRFAAADYILLGEFGSEESEILKISTVTAATRTIVTTANSKYAHAQDTKITVLKYNQIKFYRDTVSTGATAVLLATQDIDADSEYTNYYDTTNTTGYGFFSFYNETTTDLTTFSNPIPYTDFTLYSAKKIFDSFFSLLNMQEKNLITDSDAFLWLNEAYNRTVNALNLVNTSYMATSVNITTTSGTAEYALESDFSDVISLTDSDGDAVEKVDMNQVAEYRDGDKLSSSDPGYYLRGAYIGFIPTPTSTVVFTMYYKKKAGTLNSFDDEITFPDNQFYLLVDWMMFRAAMKLGKSKPEGYMNLWKDEMNDFKLSAHKQDNKLDEWTISNFANV